MASVKVHKEVVSEPNPRGWRLCFQWCTYKYDDGSAQDGYRFIWRKPDGKLQAARGQARLPSIADATALMVKANAQHWGDKTGEQ